MNFYFSRYTFFGGFTIRKYQKVVTYLWLSILTAIYLAPILSPKQIEDSLGIELGIRMDYLLHLGAFCFTGLLFFYGQKFNTIAFWFTFFVFYSVGMEWLQETFFGRTFNWYDIVFNILGLILSLAIVAVVQKCLKKCTC